MRSDVAPPNAGVVLVAGGEEVFVRSLESVFAGAGYVVRRAFTRQSAVDQRTSRRPTPWSSEPTSAIRTVSPSAAPSVAIHGLRRAHRFSSPSANPQRESAA